MQIDNPMLLLITLPCWAWLLLACILPFLLGLLLGSLLWRKGGKGADGSSQSYSGSNKAGIIADRDQAITRASELEKELMDIRYKVEESDKQNLEFRQKLASAEADTAGWRAKFEVLSAAGAGAAGAAALAELQAKLADCESKYEALMSRSLGADLESSGSINYGAIFQNTNLQIIEGIGPKVNDLLAKSGIVTWADLAAKQPEEIKPILEEAGSAYRMMDPTTWPRQAQLAAEGKWAELVEYQKFLDTGRENTGDFQNPSKAEQMALGILGFSNNPEDLKIVEGIGPKIEELLKAGGINNWTDLSESTVERLQVILDEAGERFRLANPSTWAKQAQLAAEGKWQELKDYQDFLTAGNEPS